MVGWLSWRGSCSRWPQALPKGQERKDRQWSGSVFQGVFWLWSSQGQWWWVGIKGKASKADTSVGVCYGPSTQDEEEDELCCKFLLDVSPLTALLLVGDLDLPDICWKFTGDRRGLGDFWRVWKRTSWHNLVSEPGWCGDPLDLQAVHQEGC